jgi:hypothetical protein
MSKAFIKKVHPNTKDSHQTSPGWMLTFVRWQNRSPKTISQEQGGGPFDVTPNLVVINDCISLTVSGSKENHTPQMSAVLKAGDINYLTAIAPGDFVFVNMLDWDSKIPVLRARALEGKSINGTHDGFKGLFKVQSVRQVLSTNPSNGAKDISFQITGYAFTEFNNVIYFNQYLIPPGAEKTPLYATNISDYWKSLFNEGELPNVQKVVSFFIRTFLGDGIPAKTRKAVSSAAATSSAKTTAELNYNTQFFVPRSVGSLLGEPNAKSAKDIYLYLMGIQEYTNFSDSESNNGFIPSIKQEPVDGRFFETNQPCQGTASIKPDYWNQTPVWSILQEYLNSPINEMYACFRVAPDGKHIMPTLVMRQTPFSSEKYSAGPATKFLNLPRWKVDPKMIYDLNLGRDEALRINFVQVFGLLAGSPNPQLALSAQMASNNVSLDQEDITRSGMRPWVITSNFALPAKGASQKDVFEKALVWKELMGDIVIGQHLKLNGSITCAGIEEPIVVGDNLELGDTVFHIESITHVASIAPNGEKVFRTKLDLTHGISKMSDSSSKIYSQMQREKMLLERQLDSETDKILPGVSDLQPDVYKAPYTDTAPSKNNRTFQKIGNNKKSKKDRKAVK